MKPSRRLLKRHLWLLFSASALAVAMLVSLPLAGAHAKVARSKNKLLSNFDIRVIGRSDALRLLNGKFSTLANTARSRMRDRVDLMVRGAQALKDQMPDAEITISPVTGLAEVISSKGGALTFPAPDKEGTEI